MPKPLRVLHCPTDVGGNPIGLAHGERAAGVDSTVAVFRSSWLRYPVDIDLGIDPTRVLHLPRRLDLLFKAMRGYDVVHFNHGHTILPMLGATGIDAPLLRALGRKVFVTFQGCEARLSSYCAEHFEISCCGGRDEPGLCRPEQDPSKRQRVRYLQKHADKVFAVNPDLLHVVEGAEFLPYTACDPSSIEPQYPRRDAAIRGVRIVHAPTARAVKGTEFVDAARDELSERYGCRWEIVEGLPHEEAMHRFAQADLAIDQLRVGWYGAFAVEMMALGKPVICYIREEDLRFVPEEMARELPIVRARPDTLLTVLTELLDEPERLHELGERSRRFVERWHDPQKIGARMGELYKDPSASFWAGFDPERRLATGRPARIALRSLQGLPRGLKNCPQDSADA